MKGRTIEEVIEIGNGYKALYFDNEEVAVVKVVTEHLLKDLEDKVSLGTVDEEEKPKSKAKEKEPVKAKEKEPEPEPDGEDYTWADLLAMDHAALVELCNENDLGTDPEDYDEEEVDQLRKEIAEEIGVEVPEDEEEEPTQTEADAKTGEGPDDEYTWDDLKEMDMDELTDLCDENDLTTDPNDFDDADEDKFRRAIANEIGVATPKIKPKKK